jgi:hypothetical protein
LQALMDEVQELRGKERAFDATKLRIRNLEEREAAVQRREVFIVNTQIQTQQQTNLFLLSCEGIVRRRRCERQRDWKCQFKPNS